jgi:hypothetical protein
MAVIRYTVSGSLKVFLPQAEVPERMLGLLETAKNKEKGHMPQKFKLILAAVVLCIYGSLPHFRNDVSYGELLLGLGIALASLAVVVASIWLYHRKPARERRTAANGQPFVRLVSHWELRARVMRRFVVICFVAGVGLLIASLFGWPTRLVVF